MLKKRRNILCAVIFLYAMIITGCGTRNIDLQDTSLNQGANEDNTNPQDQDHTLNQKVADDNINQPSNVIDQQILDESIDLPNNTRDPQNYVERINSPEVTIDQKEIDKDIPEEKMKYASLEEIPNDFSLQDAKDTGLLVLEDMDITSGLDRWNHFLAKVNSGEADEIMIAQYYTLGDASHYSTEYYNEIKDDYPVMYIFLLSFNGNTYTMSHYEGEQFYKNEYNYMIERIGYWSSNAAKAEHFFALVNDKELNYHDLVWSMLSSSTADMVDFRYVFNESISFNDYYSYQPGIYKTQDGLAWVTLDENCRFVFNRNIATNYDPSGRYYVEGDRLVLQASEDEEYIFEIKGDGVLKFISGESAETLVGVGREFIYETK